ncbi:MAG: hypothetical protein H6631_18000 [Anaerolineaceae bacterium]|nr:hypothetical protein [Anaerolineaceae bacterium]MCB9101584.1 hypothetical protein [Anaerolineales bacterium]
MLSIYINVKGPLRIHFPPAYCWAELLDLSHTFLDYDRSLPPERQSKTERVIVKYLPRAIEVYDNYHAGIRQRDKALQALKQIDQQAVPLTREIYWNVKAATLAAPEQAAEWGYTVKDVTGVWVRPHSRPNRLALLNAYIAQEERRPVETRFSSPDLATVKQARDALAEQWAAYQSGLELYRSSYVAGKEAFRHLSVCLRLAAVNLMLFYFDHKLSFELQQWGFTLVERQTGQVVRSEAEVAELIAPEPMMGEIPDEDTIDAVVEPDHRAQGG